MLLIDANSFEEMIDGVVVDTQQQIDQDIILAQIIQ